MCRQWILIGQFFLKTLRTKEDKNIPSRRGEGKTQDGRKSWAAQGSWPLMG